MNIYSFLRPVLFMLDAERAHNYSMQALSHIANSRTACKIVSSMYARSVPSLPVTCMGLDFASPLGLAAGLDKSACAAPALSALGFSGLELGTVTPQPQPGNAKPRLFRLPEDEAIINRMGFNSSGVDAFLENLLRPSDDCVIGINIGKNAITAIEDAHLDYINAMQRVFKRADYIAINISSPNTASLRDLQNAQYLDALLQKIKASYEKCAQVHKKQVPLALKVAPDLDECEIETIAELLIAHQFDALIASNTTVSRPDDLRSPHKIETGGLSGAPVKHLSTKCIAAFYRHLRGQVQIIGVGGIKNADDAWEKLLAGADYLQVYSQFIYQGPTLIRHVVAGIQQKLKHYGYQDIATAMRELRSENN